MIGRIIRCLVFAEDAMKPYFIFSTCLFNALFLSDTRHTPSYSWRDPSHAFACLPLPPPQISAMQSPAIYSSTSSLISCSREGIMCTWNLNKFSEPLEALTLRPADVGGGGALPARPVAPTAFASCQGDVGETMHAHAEASLHMHAPMHTRPS